METVALIAGLGDFPLEVAAGARRHGIRVVAVGLRELAPQAIEDAVDRCVWLYLGEMEKLFATLREERVERVLMAGKVPKTFLWERPDALRPDATAMALLKNVPDRKDDSLLGAVADVIEGEGFRILSQAELTPELLAPTGSFAGREPLGEELADVTFGWPVAKTLGGLDIGQSVVVQDRAVLALEAVEGTDLAIRRGCGLAEEGKPISVIKVAKPSQDLRFDVPLVGTDTIRTMAEAGATLLAIEAGITVVLDRQGLVRAADEAGIAVVGVDPSRPLEGAER
jgi:DUF1009 family protein